MASLFIALVAFAGPNDAYWNQNRSDDRAWNNIAVPIARLSQDLQGRILELAIQPGMSRRTTDLLLGTQREESSEHSLSGATITEYRILSALGVCVIYQNDRVVQVPSRIRHQ